MNISDLILPEANAHCYNKNVLGDCEEGWHNGHWCTSAGGPHGCCNDNEYCTHPRPASCQPPKTWNKCSQTCT